MQYVRRGDISSSLSHWETAIIVEFSNSHILPLSGPQLPKFRPAGEEDCVYRENIAKGETESSGLVAIFALGNLLNAAVFHIRVLMLVRYF